MQMEKKPEEKFKPFWNGVCVSYDPEPKAEPKAEPVRASSPPALAEVVKNAEARSAETVKFLFTRLRPTVSSVTWGMARAVWLTDPTSVALDTTNTHLQMGSPCPHDRLIVKIGDFVARIHIYFRFTEGGGKRYMYATTIDASLKPSLCAKWE
jgi:hypothetical protein